MNSSEGPVPEWRPLEAAAPGLLPDMMWMGRIHQDGVVIELYKHGDTRRYLNLDSDGQAWRRSAATYEQIPVAEALAHVLS